MVVLPDILANPDVLDQLILWRVSDPRFMDPANARKEGFIMQRQWNIEARMDFADQEKNEAINKAFMLAAAHIHATLILLSDGQKPQVRCFSDDFFAGHDDLDWQDDKLGKVIAAHATITGDTTEVNDELLAALREKRDGKS